MNDPERIYLEPGEGDPYDRRQWCDDNVWAGDEAYEGLEATEYIRADLRNEAVPAALRSYASEVVNRLEAERLSPLEFGQLLDDCRNVIRALARLDS